MKTIITTKGEIPYLELNGIEMPVMISINKEPAETTLKTIRPPKTDGGFLVFATPGGGQYISNLVVEK